MKQTINISFNVFKANFLKQHFPFNVTMNNTIKANSCWLAQDGYVTLYNTDWKVPTFTAEKLEEGVLNTTVSKKFTANDFHSYNSLKIN